MSRQYRYVFFDAVAREYYDPWNLGARIFAIAIPKRDLVTFRGAITQGRSRISPTTFKPVSGGLDISDRVSAVLGLKTSAQYNDQGEFTYATQGFDTGDTAWMGSGTAGLALGLFSISASVAAAKAAGRYLSEIQLLTVDAKTLSLQPDDGPLPCDLNEVVSTGAEATPDSGDVSLPHGTAEIADEAVSVAVNIPGLKSTGAVNIDLRTSSGGFTAWSSALTDDTLTITVPGSPGTGTSFIFGYNVVAYQ